MVGASSWLQDQLQISVTTQIIVVALASAFGVWMLTKRRYKLPPGPTPLPLLGNVLTFMKKDFGASVADWHKEFGPAFTIYVGTNSMVFISDIELLNEAYVKRGADFSGRPFIHSMDIASEGSKDIFMSTYGEVWKLQRKIASQAMRQYLTGSQMEERIHEVLQPVIRSMLEQNEPFNPHKHISLAVFNVLIGICFGRVMDLDNPEFTNLVRMFDETNDNFGNGFLEDIFPPLRLWPTKRYQATLNNFDTFNKWIHKNMDEQKEKFYPENLRNLTDNIILAKQQVDANTGSNMSHLFTDTHAAQTLSNVFEGGVDTSRTQLDWIIFVMAVCPDIQKKVHDEIDRVVGDSMPGKEHRAKLVYTDAVILEALRLYPVAPLGAPHETMQDTTIGAYEIPAKTTVVANQIAILHDPKHWDDPLAFKPERFLDESGTKLISRGRGQSWIPFSLGHRACVGESLAKMQMGYLFAGLMQKLHFKLSADSNPDLSCNQVGFINRPRDYKVIVSSRYD